MCWCQSVAIYDVAALCNAVQDRSAASRFPSFGPPLQPRFLADGLPVGLQHATNTVGEIQRLMAALAIRTVVVSSAPATPLALRGAQLANRELSTEAILTRVVNDKQTAPKD